MNNVFKTIGEWWKKFIGLFSKKEAEEKKEEPKHEAKVEKKVEPKTEKKEEVKTEKKEEPKKEAKVAPKQATTSKDGVTSVSYNKSFTAKLIQSDESIKEFYSELKNYVLTYRCGKKKLSDRISWKYESFKLSGNVVVKMILKGKALCVCLPLDAKKYIDSKYHVEDVSKQKSLVETPCMIRVRSERKLKYAKELIDEVMIKLECSKKEIKYVNYAEAYPTQSLKALLEKGLIKPKHHNYDWLEVLANN